MHVGAITCFYYTECKIKVVGDRPKVDLLQFLIDNNVQISFSTTCRECGYDYHKVPNGYYHDCKTQELHKIIFPWDIQKEAEKKADELLANLIPQTMVVSDEAFDQLTEATNNPPEPKEKLKEAMKAHRNKYGSSIK